MPINEKLASVVLEQLSVYLKAREKTFRGLEKQAVAELALLHGIGKIDTISNFKITVGHYTGCGYDFQHRIKGERSKIVFNRAVSNSRYLSNISHEQLVASDIVDGRYGWYVTRTDLD